MELDLFTTTDSKNTIGKTLADKHVININLKSDTDLKQPTLILSKSNVTKNFNYAKFPTLGLSYFIVDKSIMNNDHVRLQLKADLLETYKQDILNSTAIITAKDTPSYIDSTLPVDSRTEIDKYASDVTLPDNTSFVMVTVGG